MPILTRFAVCLAASCALAFLALAQSSDQDAKEAKKPAGSISGRITINGKPAVGITVALRAASNTNKGLLAQTKTDEEGRYRLTVAEAGRYLVTTFSFAFAPPMENTEVGDPGKVVMVAEGEEVEGADLALVPGGVISGRVIDARDRPLINAQVYAIRLDGRTARRGDEILQTPGPGYSGLLVIPTDDRGIYRICGLPAGRYLVGVMREENPLPRALVYHPGVSSHQQARPVEVAAGNETANVDIRFGALAKSFTVSGQIVEAETKEPVPAIYSCEPETIGPDGQPRGYESSDTAKTSDRQGRFEIKGLPPGRYRLTGGEPEMKLYVEPFYFEVTDHDLTGLEIKCYRGATISGLIVVEGEGAEDGYLALPPVAFVTTPATGTRIAGIASYSSDNSFEIQAVPPGRITIQFQTTESNQFSLLRVERNGVEIRNVIEPGLGGQLTGGIEVKAGDHIGDVRVVVADGQGIVRGQVKIEGGTLPEGLRLSVQCRRVSSQSGLFKQASVDALGRFEFQNLSPGDYELQLGALNLAASDAVTAQQLQMVRQTVKVQNGATTTVKLILNLSAESKEQEP